MRWTHRMGVVAGTALLAAFIFLTASPRPAAAQLPPECPRTVAGESARTAMTPEGAVCAVVQAGDSVYAGDCAVTASPRDIGKVCSKFIAQRGSVRAYLVGRTFSEFNGWIFVGQTRSGWTALGTAPLDFSAPALVVPWPEHTVVPEPQP